MGSAWYVREDFVQLEYLEPTMVGREKEPVQHLSEQELEQLLTEANDIKVYKRLVFLKLLYGGATLAEGAGDVGVLEGTASN